MHVLMIPRRALKALAYNKLRTGLIGVGAVICVVAIRWCWDIVLGGMSVTTGRDGRRGWIRSTR